LVQHGVEVIHSTNRTTKLSNVVHNWPFEVSVDGIIICDTRFKTRTVVTWKIQAWVPVFRTGILSSKVNGLDFV
jgi:hypothetical protein